MAYNKQQIDKDAEQQGKALAKQGKRKHSKRVRNETGGYSRDKFDKLFTDKLHEAGD